MGFILELSQFIGVCLVSLLPLANPLTTVAMFLSLSAGMSKEHRKQQINMTCIYVFAIIIVTFYSGSLVMDVFGISIPGLRIAGGLIVSLLGFQMLFPHSSYEQRPEVENRSKEIKMEQVPSIAFVPLAMPGTAGPGTIAMIISGTSSLKSGATIFSPYVLTFGPVLAAMCLCGILWLCLRSSEKIMHWMGKSGVDAMSRVMGFLLVCMGVQFVINGVFELIRGFSIVSG